MAHRAFQKLLKEIEAEALEEETTMLKRQATLDSYTTALRDAVNGQTSHKNAEQGDDPLDELCGARQQFSEEQIIKMAKNKHGKIMVKIRQKHEQRKETEAKKKKDKEKEDEEFGKLDPTKQFESVVKGIIKTELRSDQKKNGDDEAKEEEDADEDVDMSEKADSRPPKREPESSANINDAILMLVKTIQGKGLSPGAAQGHNHQYKGKEAARRRRKLPQPKEKARAKISRGYQSRAKAKQTRQETPKVPKVEAKTPPREARPKASDARAGHQS